MTISGRYFILVNHKPVETDSAHVATCLDGEEKEPILEERCRLIRIDRLDNGAHHGGANLVVDAVPITLSFLDDYQLSLH